MDDFTFDDLLPDFIEEAEEHLRTIETDLLGIECGGNEVDHDLVNNIFRGVHSIKGAAGFLQLGTIGSLAHALEAVLDEIRTDSLAPDSGVIDALLVSADALSELVQDVSGSNERDVSEFVNLLGGVLAGSESPADGSQPEHATPPEPTPAATPAATPDLTPDPAIGPAKSAPAPAQRTTPTAASEQPRAARTAISVAPEATIRVSVSTLDHLMNLAGELVLGRNQLQRLAQGTAQEKLEEASHRIDQVTSELQASVMVTRMQPLGTVFGKFPRVVRDLCKRLGKQAQLVITGEEVDLDRSLIEAIGDPLTHIVRNSIDHGIEAPEVRVAAGKPAQGVVNLSAHHEDGKVHIVIRDDGGGIDPERMRRAAVERGTMDEGAAAELDDREAINLIFHPGFSTAEQVTEVSGRGVGMDVVKTNLEGLGGSVDVESTIGQGSVITIKVPLTMAIMDSIIVSHEGQAYAFPQANVRELVSLQKEVRIEQTAGRPVLRLRDSLLPLVELADIVGSTGSDDARSLASTVVVVDSGAVVFGICIQGRPDLEEIVVKPLGSHLEGVPEFGGATLLGDGSVALILDVNGIASRLRLRSGDESEDATEVKTTITRDGQLEELVLFGCHPAETFALPMPNVARIERVPASFIRDLGGRLILEREQGLMALVRPGDVIAARPMEEQAVYHVLVTGIDGLEFGILIARIDDVLRVDLELDMLLHEPGVFGSFQHAGRTVRLLDVAEIASQTFPERLPAPLDEQVSSHPLRLLFAEDSRFMRSQMSSFFEQEGLEVTACEDGAIAWDRLVAGATEFDLIVTDIEMPNMDGLELTRRVKSHPIHGALPVIAVTSLSSDADVERGRLAGLDDYQVKLDKSGLIRSIRNLTGRSA